MPPRFLHPALAAAVMGCGAGWHQPAVLSPGPLPPRQQVEVWSRGEAHRWQAVAVTRDSISGVSFLEAPTCTCCRVSLPRSAVDSVRLGSPVAGFWKTLGLVVGGMAAVMAMLCDGGCQVGN